RSRNHDPHRTMVGPEKRIHARQLIGLLWREIRSKRTTTRFGKAGGGGLASATLWSNTLRTEASHSLFPESFVHFSTFNLPCPSTLTSTSETRLGSVTFRGQLHRECSAYSTEL